MIKDSDSGKASGGYNALYLYCYVLVIALGGFNVGKFAQANA